MKRIIKTFSVVIICLFFLAVFGWMSVHLSKGDKDFGFLNKPIKFMYSFLDQFNESVKEVKKLPPTFLKTPEKNPTINKLTKDLKVLTSYTEKNNNRTVAIVNLKNDSIIYKWALPDSVEKHDRITNPITYSNKDLIYSVNFKTGLRRVDSLCNVIWKQDSIIAHHALNMDSSGNLWTCSRNIPHWVAGATYKLNGREVYYLDDYITKIDATNGNILFHKSITEILTTNNLSNYLLHSQSGIDPIHLNDVQPALKTTKYYKEGDLFLSLKQISLILHYRPSTNKVLRTIQGSFSAQHDVDFYNDTTLTIFNNNYYQLWMENSESAPKNRETLKVAGDFYSNIVQYNFATEEISFIGDSIFRANQIFTQTEGLHEFIDDSTYFVEEQNVGYIWVIQNDEVIYKNVFKSPHEGYHHLPNWTRIIKE